MFNNWLYEYIIIYMCIPHTMFTEKTVNILYDLDIEGWTRGTWTCSSVKKLENTSDVKLLLSFTVIPDVYRSYFVLWNQLNKAVPGKCHGSCGHGKRNCLKNRDNFHTLEHGKLSEFLRPCHSYRHYGSYTWIFLPFNHTIRPVL